MKTSLFFITVGCEIIITISGVTGLVCSISLESVDLSCLLRWDCPRASMNTTYTVQTKTQGEPWKDVPWCVWVSTHSCSVSQAFSNFELYNMVRLGVHPDTTSTVWMKPVKFDYSDFTFSPPSISVSLREERLVVQVHFPCAANRRCSTKLCCPISQLIDPWTTVTMNSDVNMTSQQSRTVWTHDVVSYVEFSGLSPGQNYCVVANFSFPTFSMAASPKSDPQCIRTTDANQSELQSQLLLGIGSTFLFLFLFLFLVVFLLKQRSKTTKSRSAPVPVPLPPSLVPVPVDPEDVHLELTEDDHQITVLLF